MKNKKGIFILVFVIAIAGLLYSFFAYQNHPTKIVFMKDKSFEPSKFSIQKGTRVIFKNQSSHPKWPASDYHPTHGIYPEFDPLKGIPPGKDWEFTFDKIGKWRFHDHLDPIVRGTVTVTK